MLLLHLDFFFFFLFFFFLLFFLNRHYNPSTIVEPSQQAGFYRVLVPAARQTPNLEDR